MSENIQITILKKQNTQLAARIDNYRKINKELLQKNQGLSIWSANMAFVLSSIQGAFKVFISNQESFYELIKPNNKESLATVTKCVHHFKRFNEILSNLSNKIYQNQRSNEFTKETKKAIESLVETYQMFFKQFLRSYFSNNQKYEEWLTSAINSPDLREQYRDVFKKQKECQQEIKKFNLYFDQLRGKLPSYTKQNEEILLGDLLKKKNQQVDQLTQRNSRLSHRFRLLMDYNPNVVNQSLVQSDNYSCLCGGVQIQYLKEKWEQLQKAKKQQKIIDQSSQKGLDSEERKILQNQIEQLIMQNTQYLNRNEQLRIQNNIQQSIFKSHAYNTLVEQTRQLVLYCGTLQKNIKQLQNIVIEMEMARQKELRELKEKYQNQKKSTGLQPPIIKVKALDNSIIGAIKEAFAPFVVKIQQNKLWEERQLKMQRDIRQNNQKVRLESEASAKKYQEYFRREEKVGEIQFKHQSHKALKKQVQQYLPKGELLQKFNEYIKSRQKKVQNCQKHVRKLTKQLQTKTLFCDNIKKNLEINQSQFVDMSVKNSMLNEGIRTLEQHIKKVYNENIELKTNNQKERLLLQLKLKSQYDTNSANEQKIKLLNQKISEYEKYPIHYDQYSVIQIKNQQIVFNQIKERLQATEEENYKTNELLNNKESKLREYQKSQKKYTEVNERLRSKLNAINKTQAQHNQENTDQEKLNYALIQLQEFKGKYYCSCQNQRKIEVSLKTCPHVFCRNCVEDVNKNRSRACPICRVKFSRGDINYMKWT